MIMTKQDTVQTRKSQNGNSSFDFSWASSILSESLVMILHETRIFNSKATPSKLFLQSALCSLLNYGFALDTIFVWYMCAH